MPTFPRHLRFFLPTFVIALLIDKVTKLWIVDRFAYGERMTIIDGFFNLTHVRNPGGAFSFLATLPEDARQVFFLGTGVVAIVLLGVFLWKLENDQWLSAMAIGAVLGGAIGNLTDRLVYGEVIDFLDFRLIGGYIWPTFNMADCWIVVGVGILMIEMFFEEEEIEPPTDDGEVAKELSPSA